MAVTLTWLSYPSSIDGITLSALMAYDNALTNRPIVVVMHGFTQQVDDFDTEAYNRFAKGTYLTLTSVTGTFVAGETITGGTSGATAIINVTGSSKIVCRNVSGTFTAAETITGGTSGATGTASTVNNTTAVALFVEMRGRSASQGTPDSGGRELQDIIDAVDYVVAAYPSLVDSAHKYIVGYSGGGANVFGVTARYPDYFNSAAVFFGISDYGYDATNGWYNNGASSNQRLSLRNWIGGTPTEWPDRYHSRAYVLAITNHVGGYLRIYHDTGDPTVPVINSQNVDAALTAASLGSYYTYSESNSGSAVRWIHDLPLIGRSINIAEIDFMPEISAKTRAAWTVATSGTLKVPGYLVTKRFALWLGNGRDEFGQVVYNTTTKTFTITTDTGAYKWALYIPGQTPGAGYTVTVNSVAYPRVADANGLVTVTPPTTYKPRPMLPPSMQPWRRYL